MTPWRQIEKPAPHGPGARNRLAVSKDDQTVCGDTAKHKLSVSHTVALLFRGTLTRRTKGVSEMRHNTGNTKPNQSNSAPRAMSIRLGVPQPRPDGGSAEVVDRVLGVRRV